MKKRGKKISGAEGTVNPTTLDSDTKLRVHQQAQTSMNELIHLAENGDQLSIILLLMIGVQAVDAVNSRVKQRPEFFLTFSPNLFVWPALISRKRGITSENNKLMKTLRLGEGRAYFSSKQFRLSAPSTEAALGLFLMALLKREEWKLPPLEEGTKRIWFERSWDEKLRQGIVPEDVPKLARLGQSAVGKKSNQPWNVGAN